MRRNRAARKSRDREAAQAQAAQLDGARGSRSRRAPARAASCSVRSPRRHRRRGPGAVGHRARPAPVGLAEPLKELGEVEVPVKLHADVVATVTVEVVAD